jgi:hypothetical protein
MKTGAAFRGAFFKMGERMNTFTITLAGERIRINALHAYAREYCREYLTEGDGEISITIKPEDIEYERAASARQDRLEGIPVRQFSDGYLETLAIYRQIAEKLLPYGVVLCHGSVVSVDGQAYLFTAVSGTGKSTHTRLWRQRFGERCVMVNDDKPLLRITERGVLACGTPWDGKHRLSNNIAVPLKGYVILERGERNEIAPISTMEAFPMLLQQSHRPTSPVELAQYLSLLEQITKKTGLYRLKCNMDPEAAQVAYDGMQKEN